MDLHIASMDALLYNIDALLYNMDALLSFIDLQRATPISSIFKYCDVCRCAQGVTASIQFFFQSIEK